MDNTLENGTRLNGRFEIKKHINSGAFGIVYLVEDKDGNEKAIKELFIEKYHSRNKNNKVYLDPKKCKKEEKNFDQYYHNKFDELKQDMKDEFGIIKKMKSNVIFKIYEWFGEKLLKRNKPSRILEVYNYFEENNTLYLIMEYIKGENLETILNNNDIYDKAEDLPEKEMEKLLHDLCETIKLIHKNGYVHRDIKPSNIMKDTNGNYRLVDYSTIKKIDTEINSMVGTKYYRPPEYDKVNGRKFYKSSDIYSLGMSIYHVLKKSLPLDYEDRDDVNEKRFQDKILSIDNKFKIMIQKMTNLNPKERYQDMSELGREIKCGTIISNIFLTLIIVTSVLIGGGVYLLTQKYSIDIKVTPPDAQIVIDGEKFNPNQKYSQGSHSIDISKKGYEKEVVDIDLSRDKQPIKVDLLPNSYFIQILVEPKPNNAEISIKNINSENYEKYSKTTKYKTGKYDVMIRCKGYKTGNRVIEVPKEKGFSYKLKPKNSTPTPDESKSKPTTRTTPKYNVTKSSSHDMVINKALNFCKRGNLPTIEQFKILNNKEKKCYWSSTKKSLKQYYYQGSEPYYINAEYSNKKCFVKCITTKLGGT